MTPAVVRRTLWRTIAATTRRSALYHESVHDTGRTEPSYWEETARELRVEYPPLQHDQSCDVVVIGGGFTGLSTALHLARDHGIDVRVLEAGPVGWGASGRNGGFCTPGGSKLSLAALLKRYGEQETRRYLGVQAEAVEMVRSLCDEEDIDCDRCGDGVYAVAHSAARLAELRAEASQLQAFGLSAHVLSPEEFRQVAHESTEQHGGLHVRPGFGLHPLKFALGLARAAVDRGAVVHPRSPVLEWHRDGDRHVLVTPGGRLRAHRVVVATNGYYRDGLHRAFDGRILPVLSNIIVTRPLTPAERGLQGYLNSEPVHNTRLLLFYYRMLPDGRMLFGARGDPTGRPEAAEAMRAWMTRRFGEVFPAWRDVDITHFWRGLICVSRRLSPTVGRLDDDPTVWFGFGYHGNGVSNAPWTGRRLARAIAGVESVTEALPVPLRGLPARFPLPGLRRMLLRSINLACRIRDLR